MDFNSDFGMAKFFGCLLLIGMTVGGITGGLIFYIATPHTKVEKESRFEITLPTDSSNVQLVKDKKTGKEYLFMSGGAVEL